MIKRQAYRCAISGVRLEPEIAEADHTIPITSGGANVIENIEIVHRVINRMKGTLSRDEFIYWCRLVTKHHDEENNSTTEGLDATEVEANVD